MKNDEIIGNYFNGDAARFTGNVEKIHGGTFYEHEIVEGHRMGKIVFTQNEPSKISKNETEAEAARRENFSKE